MTTLALSPDSQLEQRIDAAMLALCTAETPEARREWLTVLEDLVSQRSAEQVESMEVERGLR